MNSHPKANAGFTLIETLLSCAMLGFLISAVFVGYSAYRAAFRSSGSILASGRLIAINPDDSVTAKAQGLATELISILPQARFIVCADAPQDPTQIATMHALPSLSAFSRASMQDDVVTRQILQTNGVAFAGTGYTAWMVGPYSKILGALRVETRPISADGDAFLLYMVSLYGSYDNGVGLLYSYEFVSPQAAAQAIAPPKYSNGTWSLTLPDPALQTELPNGSPLTEAPKPGLIFDAIAHF